MNIRKNSAQSKIGFLFDSNNKTGMIIAALNKGTKCKKKYIFNFLNNSNFYIPEMVLIFVNKRGI